MSYHLPKSLVFLQYRKTIRAEKILLVMVAACAVMAIIIKVQQQHVITSGVSALGWEDYLAVAFLLTPTTFREK